MDNFYAAEEPEYKFIACDYITKGQRIGGGGGGGWCGGASWGGAAASEEWEVGETSSDVVNERRPKWWSRRQRLGFEIFKSRR